jgi:Polyketide cyclase / dehydrase and lipid transport
MQGDVISVERVVHSSPEAIFAIVADASRHPEIDGSGAVKGLKPGASNRLSLGSKFAMSMKLGIGYSMVNEVIEFEDGRRIAWQARPTGLVGRFVGGRIWRYELEPVDGGTRVRESWDISKDHQRSLLRLGPVPEQARLSMERTLEKIEQMTAGSS